MSPEDRSTEIEELAELVAEEHWRAGRVDPAEIAKASGLTFNFGRYGDFFDGYLECKAHRFHVYINLDRNTAADAPRARFSFAHELGHYFLDWHRSALDRGIPAHASQADFASDSVVEQEADLFAANLLLPRQRIRSATRGRRLGADEIERLAQLFGTSLSATAIRCARLDLAPVIVMRWSATGRAWCWSSSNYERLTGNKAYRALTRIPPDSVTRQTIDGSGRADNAVHERGTTLATWFPGIRTGSYVDEILVEECIGLGRYGALTILRQA